MKRVGFLAESIFFNSRVFLLHFFVCFSESRGIYGKCGHFEAVQIFPKAMQSLLSVPTVTNVWKVRT